MKTTKTLLTFGGCLLMAGQAWGVEYWLRAAPTTITLPDGTSAGRTVTMWGFAMDSSATANDGTVTVPGPTIVVRGDVGSGLNLVPGDINLTIHLKNYLPEPVSIVIPGQLGAALGDPAKFTPTGDTRERARSLTHEAAASDGITPTTADYVWNNIQPGTYLYHSGSHMAVQVQMGLYGAMTKIHATTGADPTYQAYQGVDYKRDTILFYSEVDVDVHDAVAGGNYGPGLAMSSTSLSQPQYFLINGKPYTSGQVPTSLGVVNQAALLRFLNTGHDTHIPILNGLHLQLVAENGKPYLDRKNAYAVNLPSLQTVDARLPAAPLGVHALYDRRLGLSDAANASGGMLTYLAVGQTVNRNPSITIRSSGAAQTYPSTLLYAWPAGTAGTIGKVTITLQNLSHPRPEDLDILLVSPAGTAVLIMSDGGGTSAIPSTAPVTLTFDDAASASLTSSALVSGTYKPTNLAPDPEAFTGSAPPGSPTGVYPTSLSAFNGQNPNGTWRLFIFDDTSGPGATTGTLASGWSITIAPKQ